jgi:dTMP kinase
MLTLKKGLLIAIEGIDGSGKSSLAKNLHQELMHKKYPTVLTKEPGATPLGQKLRTIVQEKKVAICPQAEFMLFAADRAQHFNECIIPQRDKGNIIISDRMADSSIVYQGYGRGLDINTIKMINAWAMQNIKPDITIFVRVSAAVAMQRIMQRNVQLTSFEKEKAEFVQKLMAGFDDIYKSRNDVIIIDGEQSLQTVTHQATTALLSWITTNHIAQPQSPLTQAFY